MNFLIVTHVQHVRDENGKLAGYAPYVREMNLWLKYCSKVTIVAPLSDHEFSSIDMAYTHNNLDFVETPAFKLTSSKDVIKSVFVLPVIFVKVIAAMSKADHIHLRCPGNMGLVGAFAQIMFPYKKKTAKYAGNWDWKSKQPWSYRLQQRILQNTFLTKNIQVLVYGNWTGATKNIKPFFTATYRESDKVTTPAINVKQKPLRLIFVGGLNQGKQPLLSVQVCQEMIKHTPTELHLYGDGEQRLMLEEYVAKNGLENAVIIHGNQSTDVVKKAMQESHFLIFISKSEGWPKVVAEAMFWGCLPITTAVSCVPEMLGHGDRGSLVEDDVDQVVNEIEHYLDNEPMYRKKVNEAMKWSRKYTLDRMEDEIKRLLNN